MFDKKGMLYGGYVWAFLFGIIGAIILIALLYYWNIFDITGILPQAVPVAAPLA